MQGRTGAARVQRHRTWESEIMHVYLREELVELRMRHVEGEGLVPEGSDLIPVAFYADENPAPSFRALLPPETVTVLEDALEIPVQLGVLAEEPEDPDAEVRAMVGLAVPVGNLEGMQAEQEEEPEEPWKASAGSSEAWRGEDPADEPQGPRTALLAFAPLVRIKRKFPDDFAEELADLLEAALAGATRPSLEARIDRLLGDL